MDSHSVEPKYECPDCGEKFKHQRKLRYHMKVKSTEDFFAFDITRVRLFHIVASHSKLAILIVLQLHTGEGLLNCPTCNKTFFTQSALTGHMAVHMDIQPFECSLCGKRYKHAKALQLHLEDHDGTRQRFQCAECDRTFKVSFLVAYLSLSNDLKVWFILIFCSTQTSVAEIRPMLTKS